MASVVIDKTEYRFFNHLYAVSRRGKILRKLAPFTPRLRKDGYLEAGKVGLVHRMVALLWVEKPPEAILVHHKNSDKSDNRANNLEWVTPKQHMGEKHADTAGRHTVTEGTRRKLRQFRLGRKDSEKTKARKRAILLSVSVRKRACVIKGVRYRSFLSAHKALGIHFHTIRYRCLSENFPNYKLL